jgi:hypothetical protein
LAAAHQDDPAPDAAPHEAPALCLDDLTDDGIDRGVSGQ